MRTVLVRLAKNLLEKAFRILKKIDCFVAKVSGAAHCANEIVTSCGDICSRSSAYWLPIIVVM